MLTLLSKLENKPVLSLQTGSKIAEIKSAVIDPATLDIVAYHISGKGLKPNSLLLTNDIREVGSMGCIIDSFDEIVSETDMVKLRPLIKLNFEIIDKQIISENKTKLGKVFNCTIDPLNFRITQLYVKKPLIKSLNNNTFIVNRSQIKEINNKYIVVDSTLVDSREVSNEGTGQYVNPFRKSPSPQTGANTLKD